MTYKWRASFLGLALIPAQVSAAKPVIETAAQLPRHTYLLPHAPSHMLDYPNELATLAAAADRDAAATLAIYDIRDTAARRQLLSIRKAAAMLRGDMAAAASLGREAAALQDKESLRLTANIETLGMLAASRGPTAGRRDAYRAAVTKALAALPPEKVRVRLIEQRGSIDLSSPAYARGELMTYADPVWKRETPIASNYATWLLGTAAQEKAAWPYRPAYRAALTDWLTRHPAPAGEDIWPARSVRLSKDDGLTSVGVAIWDVGVDRTVFAGHNTVVPTLSFDEAFRSTVGDLKRITTAVASHLASYERYMRGRGILAQGADGPDATYARSTIARLGQNDIASFEEGSRFYTGYIHGTHVAGIAAAGDPAIRIVPVRVTFSDAAISPVIDEAVVARMLASARASVAYMKANSVRVANMSWGITGEEVESSFAQNNLEPDPAKRTARAQAVFETLFNGMQALMADAPEILFVIAAGNANQDLDFVRDMPGSINLPNVLSVGAVDRAGGLTSFASTGKSVDLYALGNNVESFVPGGGKVVWSGASLAAPQVANAAAKVLTINPSFTTEQVVAILRETATPSTEKLPLLNAREAVERARAERPTRN